MIPGFATAEGAARFMRRFPQETAAGFFRPAVDAHASSIGIGSYLGAMDDATDRGYAEAVTSALRSGVNFIDTSLNYRNQRSELAIASALAPLLASGEIRRDEFVVCTKAGYLVPGAVPQGVLKPDDLVGGSHSIAPAFIGDQLGRSRGNLGLETIDVFYLHNPETQLGQITHEQFYARLRTTFEFLEEAAAQGGIRYYGLATWDGFRRGPGAPEGLSLPRIVAIAREVAGDGHRCRFVQLPFNLAMPEAFTLRRDGRSFLEDARELGVTVVASASLLQARLSRNLPDEIAGRLPGASTDAQLAIQFTRSTPGVTVALVGMSQAAHVRENLALARVPPASEEQYLSFYTQS
jgi:aryl-alcohol dehydrogenase-like predicted oxidoreductase